MARKKPDHLRIATESDVPRRKLSLAEAVETNDLLEIFLAQRRELVIRSRDVTGAPYAAIQKSITDLSEKIDKLQQKREGASGGGAHAPTGDDSWDASAI